MVIPALGVIPAGGNISGTYCSSQLVSLPSNLTTVRFDIGYNAAMRLRRKQRPSYEQGELRDKEIEKLQDSSYQRDDFLKLVRKSAKSNRKPAR